MHHRLIDRDQLWTLFVGHYWDSFHKDRDLILSHINAVMMKVPDIKTNGLAETPDKGNT